MRTWTLSTSASWRVSGTDDWSFDSVSGTDPYQYLIERYKVSPSTFTFTNEKSVSPFGVTCIHITHAPENTLLTIEQRDFFFYILYALVSILCLVLLSPSLTELAGFYYALGSVAALLMVFVFCLVVFSKIAPGRVTQYHIGAGVAAQSLFNAAVYYLWDVVMEYKEYFALLCLVIMAMGMVGVRWVLTKESEPLVTPRLANTAKHITNVLCILSASLIFSSRRMGMMAGISVLSIVVGMRWRSSLPPPPLMASGSASAIPSTKTESDSDSDSDFLSDYDEDAPYIRHRISESQYQTIGRERTILELKKLAKNEQYQHWFVLNAHHLLPRMPSPE